MAIIEFPEEFFQTYNRPYFCKAVFFRFTEEQLQPVWDEINKIENKSKKYNDKLAGQIETEYDISGIIPYLDQLITPLAVESDEEFFKEVARFNGYSMHPNKKQNLIPELTEVWVNKQRKYEYNPAHRHLGVYSFVIWLDIPFTNEEESLVAPGRESNGGSRAGNFSLYDVGSNEIAVNHIEVDKKFNGTMAFFPASQVHSVNPFYSTDKERITVAGNYAFNIDSLMSENK